MIRTQLAASLQVLENSANSDTLKETRDGSARKTGDTHKAHIRVINNRHKVSHSQVVAEVCEPPELSQTIRGQHLSSSVRLFDMAQTSHKESNFNIRRKADFTLGAENSNPGSSTHRLLGKNGTYHLGSADSSPVKGTQRIQNYIAESAHRLAPSKLIRKNKRESVQLGQTTNSSGPDSQEVKRIILERTNRTSRVAGAVIQVRPHSSVQTDRSKDPMVRLQSDWSSIKETLAKRVEVLGEEEAVIFSDFPELQGPNPAGQASSKSLLQGTRSRKELVTPSYLKPTKTHGTEPVVRRSRPASQSSSMLKSHKREDNDPYMIFAMSEFAAQMADSKQLQQELMRRKRSPSPRSSKRDKSCKDTPEIVQQRRVEYQLFKEERTKLLIRRRELARERKEFLELEAANQTLKQYKTVVWIRRVIKVFKVLSQIKQFLLVSKVQSSKSRMCSKLKELNFTKSLLHQKTPNDLFRASASMLLISRLSQGTVRQRAAKVVEMFFVKVSKNKKMELQFVKQFRTMRFVLIRFKRHMEARTRFVKAFQKKWNNFLTDKIQEDFKTSNYSKHTRLYVNTPIAVVERLAWLFFDRSIQANTLRILPRRKDWFSPHLVKELALQKAGVLLMEPLDSPRKETVVDMLNVSLLNTSAQQRGKLSRQATRVLPTTGLILTPILQQPSEGGDLASVSEKPGVKMSSKTATKGKSNKLSSKRAGSASKGKLKLTLTNRTSVSVKQSGSNDDRASQPQKSVQDLSAAELNPSTQRKDEISGFSRSNSISKLSRANSISKLESPRMRGSLQRQGSINKERTKKKPKKFTLGLIGSGIDDEIDAMISAKRRLMRILTAVKFACRLMLIVEREKYIKKWLVRKLQTKPSQLRHITYDLSESDLNVCVILVNKHSSANFLQYKGSIELNASLNKTLEL